jgi:TorA maturation chaperone TorD
MEKLVSHDYLLKADLFRMVSKGFSYPEEGNLQELKEITAELIDDSQVPNQIKEILLRLNCHNNEEKLKSEYSRLFLKGSIPITESTLCSKLNAATDVSAFYRAFGMTAKTGEAPDALNYQLEFLSILLLKLILAENSEQEEITLSAYEKFMQEHILDTEPKFREKLLAANPSQFYLSLSDLLRWLVTKDEL